MNDKKIIVLFCSLAAVICLSFKASFSYAEDGVGGQVTTGGKISFYEGSTESSSLESSTIDTSSTDTHTSTTIDSTTSSAVEDVTKPTGKYPSTGETIKRYSLIGTGIIGFVVVLFFLRKRRKEES